MKKRTKLSKKVLSLILITTMILTSMPSSALTIFANDGEATKHDNPWDYTIFTESGELDLEIFGGTGSSISGDIHSNNDIIGGGRWIDIDGILEASGEVNLSTQDSNSSNDSYETKKSEGVKQLPLANIYYAIMANEGGKARSEIAEDTSPEDMLRTSIIKEGDLTIDLTEEAVETVVPYSRKAGAFGAGFLTEVYENPDKWNAILPVFDTEATISTDNNNKTSLIDMSDNSYFSATQDTSVDSNKYSEWDKLPATVFMNNLNGEYVSGYLNELKTEISICSDNVTEIDAAWDNSTINPESATDAEKIIVNGGNFTLNGNYDKLKEIKINSYGGTQLLGNYNSLEYIYMTSSANLNLAGNFPSLKAVYMPGGTLLLGTDEKGFNANGADIINENGTITVYTAKNTSLNGCNVVTNAKIAIRGKSGGAASKFTADSAMFAAGNTLVIGDMNDNNIAKYNEVPCFISQSGIAIINSNFEMLQGAFLSRNDKMVIAGSNIDTLQGFLYAQNGIDGEKKTVNEGVYVETVSYNVTTGIATEEYKPTAEAVGGINKIKYANLPAKFTAIPGVESFVEEALQTKNADGEYENTYNAGLYDDEESVIYIMATGDITVTAEDFAIPKGRRMIIASRNGDITFEADPTLQEDGGYKKTEIDAVFYAPNGAVNINGNDGGLTLNGRIYADTANLSGYWVDVTPQVNDLDVLNVREQFKLDDTNYEYDQTLNAYYLTNTNLNDTITSSLHTAENVEEITYAVQKLNYFTGGWHDAYIDGTLNANDRYFTINNAPLRIGLNQITFTAELENGNTIENSFYVMFYDENNLDNNDSDSDGLSNWQEEFYDTDKNDSDTDDDGLNDYFEINNSRTNPLVTDTDENGVTDSAEDFDEDELTNLEEQQHNTDCYSEDTDGDELSDSYETTTTYTDYDAEIGDKTSPTNADTDGDGANDGLEVNTLGTSPVKYDNTFTHEFTAPEVEENDITMSVYLSGVSGQELSSLTITPYESDYFLTSKTPGYLSKAFNVDIDESAIVGEKVEVTFDYPAELENDPDFKAAIYTWDGESQTLNELPTSKKESADTETFKITAEVTHTTTFVLLNKEKQDEVWDKYFLPTVERTGGDIKVETVLLIDNSGSMSGNSDLKSDPDGTRFGVARDFANSIIDLGNGSGVGVISFGEHITPVINTFTTDKNLIENEVTAEKIKNDDVNQHTYLGQAINTALGMFGNAQADTIRYIMIYTDGVGSDLRSYIDPKTGDPVTGLLDAYTAGNNIPDFAVEAKAKGVQIVTFGFGNELESLVEQGQNDLKYISKVTDGQYYFSTLGSDITAKKNLVLEYTRKAQESGDSNGDGLSNADTKLIYEGVAKLGDGTPVKDGLGTMPSMNDFEAGGSDYDNDGIPNGDELKGDSNGKVIIDSSPTEKDTDGDGIEDDVDINKTEANHYPYKFVEYINDEVIDPKYIVQTSDYKFTLYTQPCADIFEKLEINVYGNGTNHKYFDCWYLFCVDDLPSAKYDAGEDYFNSESYSILKMRPLTGNSESSVAIPFIDFAIAHISEEFKDDLKNDMERITRGNVSPYGFSDRLATYFSRPDNEANYLIANQYIDIVIASDLKDGKLKVPNVDDVFTPVSSHLGKRLGRIGIVLDELDVEFNWEDLNNAYIRLQDPSNLTRDEKKAIMAIRTANPSMNSFAAEIIYHAVKTIDSAKTYKNWGKDGNLVMGTLGVISQEIIFLKAVKADMGLGEEEASGVTDGSYYNYDGEYVKQQRLIFGDQ